MHVSYSATNYSSITQFSSKKGMSSKPGGKSGNYYQLVDSNPSKRSKIDSNSAYEFPTINQPKPQKTISQAKFITIK